ncbi:hypothetical protein [Streptomyces sp. NPDC059258]
MASQGGYEEQPTAAFLVGGRRVTVNKGEVFKSNGCQDWKKVG